MPSCHATLGHRGNLAFQTKKHPRTQSVPDNHPLSHWVIHFGTSRLEKSHRSGSPVCPKRQHQVRAGLDVAKPRTKEGSGRMQRNPRARGTTQVVVFGFTYLVINLFIGMKKMGEGDNPNKQTADRPICLVYFPILDSLSVHSRETNGKSIILGGCPALTHHLEQGSGGPHKPQTNMGVFLRLPFFRVSLQAKPTGKPHLCLCILFDLYFLFVLFIVFASVFLGGVP